jgi:hypothetical protein
VVTLVWFNVPHHFENAWIGFERTRMQYDAIEDLPEASEPMYGIFDRDPAYQSVDLISFRQKILGQIRTILTRDASD